MNATAETKTGSGPVVSERMTPERAGEIALLIAEYIWKKKEVTLSPSETLTTIKEWAAPTDFLFEQAQGFFLTYIVPWSLRSCFGEKVITLDVKIIPELAIDKAIAGQIALKYVVQEYFKIAAGDLLRKIQKMCQDSNTFRFKEIQDFYSQYVLPESAKALAKLTLK